MSRRPIICSAALVLVTVVVRLPLIIHDRAVDDEANYAVVARELIAGGTLYVDVVERRPPATFWVYAGVFRIFGADNWPALHAVAVLWVLLTMAALYRIAGRLFDARAGVAAALLYSVFQPWWYWNNQAFNGEVLMNLPVAAAFALCLHAGDRHARVRSAIAGALLATAALLKQPAAVAIVPLALYLVHPKRTSNSPAGMAAPRMTDLAWLAGGSAAILVATGLWLASTGTLAAAVYWSVLDHDVPHVFWRDAAEHTAAFIVVCLPLCAGAWWTIRRRERWERRAEFDAIVWLAVVSAIGVAGSGRFFPHYYIGLLPALSVLAAPGWSQSIARGEQGRAGRAVAVARVWIIGVAICTLIVQFRQGASEDVDTEAGRYLRMQAAPDARVFVWGRRPEIYLDSDRRLAARYIDSFALTGRMFGPERPDADTSSRIAPGAWQHLADDFAQHPPAFIVDTQSAADAPYPVERFPWLAERLRDDYRVVAVVEEGTIYRYARVTALP